MKTALVIIDFQNDFVTGSLGFSSAKNLDDIICNKIQIALKQKSDIIFTKDTHNSDYLTTSEGKSLPVEHCIKGSIGHDIYGNTAKYLTENTKCFLKETFGSIELAQYISDNNYDEITLVGLVSNICVLTNAILIKTFTPSIELIVDSTATLSFDDDLNAKTLDILKGLFIKVT